MCSGYYKLVQRIFLFVYSILIIFLSQKKKKERKCQHSPSILEGQQSLNTINPWLKISINELNIDCLVLLLLCWMELRELFSLVLTDGLSGNGIY